MTNSYIKRAIWHPRKRNATTSLEIEKLRAHYMSRDVDLSQFGTGIMSQPCTQSALAL